MPSQPESDRHPEMERPPGDRQSQERTRVLPPRTTPRPHHERHTLRPRNAAHTRGSRWEERQRQEGERGRQPDRGPGVRGSILESRPRGWRPGRSPVSQRQREQGQEEGQGGWQRPQRAKGGRSLTQASSGCGRARGRREPQRLRLRRCETAAPAVPGSSATAGMPTPDPPPRPGHQE